MSLAWNLYVFRAVYFRSDIFPSGFFYEIIVYRSIFGVTFFLVLFYEITG